MLASLKHVLYRFPLVRAASARLRSRQARRDGGKVFENTEDYARAFYRRGDDGVVLRTHDGLKVAIRRNRWDAEIVREIFFAQPYTRHVRLSPNPVVVDIGGYIGDFALYAVRYLGAARVVAYEPTEENFAMLRRNVELNGYHDRITTVKKAVGASGETVLNVQKSGGDEVHVSSYWYPNAERRALPSVSLSELLDAHRLDSVDLLKVDCEGGEYDILPDTPDATFDRIHNVVFEYTPSTATAPSSIGSWAGSRRRATRSARSGRSSRPGGPDQVACARLRGSGPWLTTTQPARRATPPSRPSASPTPPTR